MPVLAIAALLASLASTATAINCVLEGGSAFTIVMSGAPSAVPPLKGLVIGNSAALGATGTKVNTASYNGVGSGAARTNLQQAPPGGTACPAGLTCVQGCSTGVSCPQADAGFPGAGTPLGGSFADGPWASPALPAWVFETPVAIGSITLYTGGPAKADGTFATKSCLLLKDLCTIYNVNVASLSWGALSITATLPAAYKPVTIDTGYRLDSSGSTTVVQSYLAANCLNYAGINYVAADFPASPTAKYPARFVGVTATSGMTAFTRDNLYRMGYAACAQPAEVTGQGYLYDFPVKNLVNTCNRCAASTTSYTDFNIKPHGPPNCDWTGSSPDGDSDGDQDGAGDLDNDQDGISSPDFALVFLEFGNMVRHPSGQADSAGVTYAGCCGVFVNVMKYLLTSTTQTKLPPYGFYPLPATIVATSCSCLPQAHCGTVSGKVVSGKCT